MDLGARLSGTPVQPDEVLRWAELEYFMIQLRHMRMATKKQPTVRMLTCTMDLIDFASIRLHNITAMPEEIYNKRTAKVLKDTHTVIMLDLVRLVPYLDVCIGEASSQENRGRQNAYSAHWWHS